MGSFSLSLSLSCLLPLCRFPFRPAMIVIIIIPHDGWRCSLAGPRGGGGEEEEPGAKSWLVKRWPRADFSPAAGGDHRRRLALLAGRQMRPGATNEPRA